MTLGKLVDWGERDETKISLTSGEIRLLTSGNRRLPGGPELKFGSMNVRTMKMKSETGETVTEVNDIRLLLEDMHDGEIDIVTVQEARISGEIVGDEIKHRNSTYSLWGGGAARNLKNATYLGTVIIIKENNKVRMGNRNIINARITTAELEEELGRKITIANQHAPTNCKGAQNDKERKEHWKTVERLLDAAKARDVKIVAGDFNAEAPARVGKGEAQVNGGETQTTNRTTSQVGGPPCTPRQAQTRV